MSFGSHERKKKETARHIERGETGALTLIMEKKIT